MLIWRKGGGNELISSLTQPFLELAVCEYVLQFTFRVKELILLLTVKIKSKEGKFCSAYIKHTVPSPSR